MDQTEGRGRRRAPHDTLPRLLGVAALVVGGAYLGWRVTQTLGGAAPLLAVPLLAVELWALLVLALHVVELWTVPRAPDERGSPGTAATSAAPALVVDVVVHATGAPVDALARTLVGCDVLDGARDVIVVDNRSRESVRARCARHRARVLISDAPSALARVASAVASDADAVVWLEAGQMPMPELITATAPLLEAPDVAAVQATVGAYNSDSLVHLSAGRDEQAFRDEVVAPALDRWGCAPWLGAGSLIRASALAQIAGADADATDRGLSSARAALRWHQTGWTTRFVARTLVRAGAPDALGEYLADHRRRAERALSVLFSRDNALIARRLRLRHRVAHLAAGVRYLSGACRLALLAVLTGTLITGRLPLTADPAALAAWWLGAWGLSTLAWLALARGTLQLGDRTRQSWRTMGVYAVALARVVTRRRPDAPSHNGATARGGLAVLGDLPLLTAGNILLQLAMLTRAATLRWPTLLPAFSQSARLIVLGTSLVTSAWIASVLQILVRRRQRRVIHRLTVDLPVTIDGAPAHAIDLTPSGVGVLVVPPLQYHDAQPVIVGLALRRRDMSIEELTIPGTVRHGRDVGGGTRLGVELSPDAFARDLLVEYCGITYYESSPDAFSPAFVSDDLEVDSSRLHRLALRTSALAAFVLGLATLAFGPAPPAAAASLPTITWSGAGATNNWTDTGNWAGGAAPTSGQTAVFDTNVKSVTINGNINVGGIVVTSSYTGTITQSGANTVTLGSDGWTQAAATFTGGTGAMTLNGSYSQTGGTFTTTTATLTFNQAFSQSGGTFTASTGPVVMTGTFTLSGGTFTAPSTGPYGTSTLQFSSTVTYSGGTFNPNSGVVALKGSFTWNGSLTVYKLTHTSGNVAIAGGATITVNNTLTLTAGSITSGSIAALADVYATSTYTGGAGTLSIAGTGAQALTDGANSSAGGLPVVVINKSAGTFTLYGNVRTASNWTLTAGTMSAAGSTFYAAGTFTITGTQMFNAMTQTAGALTIDPASTVTIGGLLTLTGGSIASGTLDATAGLTESSSYAGGAGTIRMSGSANQSMAGTATTSAGTLPVFVVNKSGGSLSIGGTVRTTNVWTLTAGTVSYTGTVAFGGNLTVTGDQSFSSVYLQTGNVTIDSASTVTASGTVTLSGGTLAGGTLHATGAIVETSTYGGGTGTLQIDGGGAQSFSGTATTSLGALPVVVINKSAGTLTLSGTLRTGNAWTLTAGTMDAGTSVFAAAGTFTITGTQTFYDLYLATGSLTIAGGSTVTSSGTLTLSVGSLAAGTLDASGTVSELSTAAGGAGTLRIGGTGAQSFSGTATTTLGALPVVVINKPSGTLTLSGTLRTANAWTLTAGTMDASTSTFVVAGTFTITGTQSFNHLYHYAGNLTIASGSTVTVSGTLTLSSGSIISGTLDATGDTVEASTYSGGAGTLRISGSGGQSFSGTASTTAGQLPVVVVNKPSGTLTLSGTLRTGNNWTLTAGTLDPSSSTMVLNGTVTITGTQSFFNVYEYSGYLSIASGSTVTATGTLTLFGGSLLSGTLDATGDIVEPSTSGGGSGTLRISGSGAQSFSGTATTTAGALPLVVINKPSGTLTLSGTLRTANAWTSTAGTMDASTSTFVVAGNLTITGTQTFNSLYQYSGALTVATGSTVTVAGTLTLSGGSVAGGTLDAAGPILQLSTYGGGEGGTLRISGSSAQTFTGSATASAGGLPALVINKSGGTLTLAGTIRTIRSWTDTAGTLDPGASTLVLAGTQTVTGTQSFNDVNLNGSTLTVAGGTVTVGGTLTLTSGSITSGTLDATGPVSYLSTYSGGAGTLRFSGGANQALTSTATTSAGQLPNVVINKSAGTLSLAGTIRITRNWTYTAGTVDPGTSLLAIAASALTMTGSETFADVNVISGTITIASGTTITAGGTLTLTAGTINGDTLGALGDISAASMLTGGTATLRVAGSANQTFTGSHTLTVGQLPAVVVAKTGGTLTLAGTLRTALGWTRTSGTVDPGSSTVVLVGTQTISGDEPFFNVYQSAGNLTIAPASTVTASGTLTLSAGSLAAGTLDAVGPVSILSGHSGGGGTLRFSGGADQTLTSNSTTSTGQTPVVVVNKSGGTLSLSGTIRVTHDWTVTSGTIDPGTSTIATASSLAMSGTATYANFYLWGGYVSFDASSTITATGTVTLQNGMIAAGTLDATGPINAGPYYAGGAGTLRISGSADQTYTSTATSSTGQLPAVVIAKSGGTLTLAGLVRTAHDWTYVAGTVDAGTSAVYFVGTETIDAAGMTFYDLHITGSGTATLAADMHVAHDLVVDMTDTLATGGHDVHVGHGMTVDSTLVPGASSFVFDGTTAATVGGANLPHLDGVVVADSAGVDLGANLAVDGTLTLTDGDLRVGGDTLTIANPVAGTLAHLVTTASSTLVVGGSATGITVPGGDVATLSVTNATGATVVAPLTVHTLLGLSGGALVAPGGIAIPAGGATLATSGWLDGPLSRYVDGTASVAYPVGGATSAGPVTLTAHAVTTPGPITVTAHDGLHPQLASAVLDPARSVTRYWSLDLGPTQLGSVDADVGFASGDRANGVSPALLLAKRYGGGAWHGETLSAATNTSASITGLTAGGDLALGARGDADVGVDVSAPATADVDTAVDAHVTVTNHGPASATGVVATITVPASATGVSAVPAAGSCTVAGATVTCHLGSIAANGSVAVVVTFTPTVGGNAAVTAAASADQVDLISADDTASASVAVRGKADVGVTVSAPANGLVAVPVDVAVDVVNHGPETATTAVVTVDVPASANGVSAVTTGGTCSVAGTTVTCHLGSITSGATVTVTVTFSPTVTGAASIHASAAADQIDVASGNDAASATVTVRGLADVHVSVIAPVSTPRDDLLATQVVVSNSGPQRATAASVTVGLPGAVTNVSWSTTVGSCSLSGQTLTCAVGDIAAGDAQSVFVFVTPTETGDAQFDVLASSDDVDLAAGNNAHTTVVVVAAPVAPTTTTTVAPPPTASTTTTEPAQNQGGTEPSTTTTTAATGHPTTTTRGQPPQSTTIPATGGTASDATAGTTGASHEPSGQADAARGNHRPVPDDGPWLPLALCGALVCGAGALWGGARKRRRYLTSE